MKFQRLASESYKWWGKPGDLGFSGWIFPARVKALKTSNRQIVYTGNNAGGRSSFDDDERRDNDVTRA